MTTQQQLPELINRKKEFEKLCAQIDDLEQFVGVVNTNLNNIEEHVVTAEEELGINALGLKGLLMPIFGIAKKRTTDDLSGLSAARSREAYQPPEVFRTDAYFGQHTISEDRPES